MQVLVNVISNSIKFMEKGGLKLSFKQTFRDEKIILEIAVNDTGIGMTKEEVTKVRFLWIIVHKKFWVVTVVLSVYTSEQRGEF